MFFLHTTINYPPFFELDATVLCLLWAVSIGLFKEIEPAPGHGDGKPFGHLRRSCCRRDDSELSIAERPVGPHAAGCCGCRDLLVQILVNLGKNAKSQNGWLIGGLEHEFYDSPYSGNVIIPTDFHVFQREVGIPPARWWYWSLGMLNTVVRDVEDDTDMITDARFILSSSGSWECTKWKNMLAHHGMAMVTGIKIWVWFYKWDTSCISIKLQFIRKNVISR